MTAEIVPTSDATIRPMKPSDLPRVTQLTGQSGDPASMEGIDKRFAKIGEDPHQVLFVAEVEGMGVLGWIHVEIRQLLESEPTAEIAGLVVDSADRHKGVARALVTEAECWARVQGLSRLRVRSNVLRAESQEFYTGIEFKLVKTQSVYEKRIDD